MVTKAQSRNTRSSPAALSYAATKKVLSWR